LLGVGLVRSLVSGPKPVQPAHLMPGVGRGERKHAGSESIVVRRGGRRGGGWD
jgi:hypothetical protein